MPSVHPHQILNVGTSGILSTVSRFERVQQRARTAVVRERSEQEEHQWLLHIQKAVDHDHGSLFVHDSRASLKYQETAVEFGECV